MPATKNAFSPYPYQSLWNPQVHSGIVAVTGTFLVDLGIGHNNFIPQLEQQAALAADVNKAPAITWSYGTKLGTFLISAWKATAAGTTTLIAATAAVQVSFIVIADSTVG